jgi:hypothetical protein
VAIRKLSTTDAFIVVDFPDAPASGIVRRARKVLQSSATDLARSASYTFGVFGIEQGGASAGINAEGDAVEPAIAAFVAEIEPLAASGELRLVAGKGVDPHRLAPLAAATSSPASDGEVATAGILAAATWALNGELSGASVAIEGRRQAPPSLVAGLEAAGATVVDVWGVDEKPWLVWGADVDLLLAGSKPGTLSHEGAPVINARAVVPWGPIPITTKAFAQLHRGRRVQVVPDFVATAGPLLAGVIDADPRTVATTIARRIVEVLDQCAGHPDGLFLGACYQAEEFFQDWKGVKPFGRPLAA